MGNNQRYPRDFPNARTEVAWCLALDAPMCALDVLPKEHFDLGIIIIPKNNPEVNLDFIRKCCDKVAVMQEGPHWYFQDYSITHQFHFHNHLMEADYIFVHNESDKKYYRGITSKPVFVMRSLMLTDGLLPRSESGGDVIIGGNFVSWYGGFDSYMVASVFQPEAQIYAPSMGRKQELESQIEAAVIPLLEGGAKLAGLDINKDAGGLEATGYVYIFQPLGAYRNIDHLRGAQCMGHLR